MRFSDGVPALLAGTAIVSALTLTISQPAIAMTGEEVNNIAREVTVLINTGNPGSGVIIAQDDETYYVLTAKHVVAAQDEYQIVTSDRQAYNVDYSRIRQLPGVDLAVVQFTSDNDYPIATLANSDYASEGRTVFVSGWPYPGREIQERIRQFTTGQVSGRPETALADGYQLVYTNVTRVGMSGGPVFDTSGRVVGIHGRAEGEVITEGEMERLEQAGANSLAANASRVGFNLGIPINTFLSQAPQNGIYLSLRVENSAPQDLSSSYVASAEPDERDRIDDINATLDTINNGVNVIRSIFGF